MEKKNIIEKCKIYTPNTQIYVRWLSWLGTGTSIKSGATTLAVWVHKTSLFTKYSEVKNTMKTTATLDSINDIHVYCFYEKPACQWQNCQPRKWPTDVKIANSSCIGDLSLLWLFCLGTLIFLLPKIFKIIWLSNILSLSVTWWRLFGKRVVRTKLDIYVCIRWTVQALQSK